MKAILAILALAGAWSVSGICYAYSFVYSHAEADGESVRIVVGVFGGTEYSGKSIVVEASMLGSCGDVSIVTPDPAPIAMTDAEQVFTFTIRPAGLHRIYFYVARLMDQDGAITSPRGHGQYANGSYVSCGEAIALRGVLTTAGCFGFGEVCVEPCVDGCWAACAWDVQLPFDTSGWGAYVNTGQVVDLYGEVMPPPTVMTMPGTPCMVVSRVVPVTDPAGCLAVANERSTWGGLKAMYR